MPANPIPKVSLLLVALILGLSASTIRPLHASASAARPSPDIAPGTHPSEAAQASGKCPLVSVSQPNFDTSFSPPWYEINVYLPVANLAPVETAHVLILMQFLPSSAYPPAQFLIRSIPPGEKVTLHQVFSFKAPPSQYNLRVVSCSYRIDDFAAWLGKLSSPVQADRQDAALVFSLATQADTPRLVALLGRAGAPRDVSLQEKLFGDLLVIETLSRMDDPRAVDALLDALVSYRSPAYESAFEALKGNPSASLLQLPKIAGSLDITLEDGLIATLASMGTPAAPTLASAAIARSPAQGNDAASRALAVLLNNEDAWLVDPAATALRQRYIQALGRADDPGNARQILRALAADPQVMDAAFAALRQMLRYGVQEPVASLDSPDPALRQVAAAALTGVDPGILDPLLSQLSMNLGIPWSPGSGAASSLASFLAQVEGKHTAERDRWIGLAAQRQSAGDCHAAYQDIQEASKVEQDLGSYAPLAETVILCHVDGLAAEKSPAQALQALELALRNGPRTPQIALRYRQIVLDEAAALAGQGDLETASQLLERAQAIAPSDEIRTSLVDTKLELGKFSASTYAWEAAEAEFRSALDISPGQKSVLAAIRRAAAQRNQLFLLVGLALTLAVTIMVVFKGWEAGNLEWNSTDEWSF